MHSVWQRNINSVDAGLVQEVLVGPICLRDAILLGVLLGGFEVTRRNGGYDDAAVGLGGVDDGGTVDFGCRKDAHSKRIWVFGDLVSLRVEILVDESRHLAEREADETGLQRCSIPVEAWP